MTEKTLTTEGERPHRVRVYTTATPAGQPLVRIEWREAGRRMREARPDTKANRQWARERAKDVYAKLRLGQSVQGRATATPMVEVVRRYLDANAHQWRPRTMTGAAPFHWDIRLPYSRFTGGESVSESAPTANEQPTCKRCGVDAEPGFPVSTTAESGPTPPTSPRSDTPNAPDILDPLAWMTRERDAWREHYHAARERADMFHKALVDAHTQDAQTTYGAFKPALVRCKDCAAWEPFIAVSDKGYCRRFAPQPAMAGLFPRLGHTGEVIAGWPVTNIDDNDGCMEGVAK